MNTDKHKFDIKTKLKNSNKKNFNSSINNHNLSKR